MRRDNARILVVSPTFPFPPRSGFETRSYHLVRQLARYFDVTLLSYASASELRDVAGFPEGVQIEVVRRRPSPRSRKRRDQLLSLAAREPFAVRAIRSAEMQETIDKLSTGTSFDAVQLESVLPFGFRFPVGTPLVLDEHNVEYEVFGRMRAVERSPARKLFYAVEQARVRRFEQTAWRRVAGCVVTSVREQRIVHAIAPHARTAVVPNAVDLDYFRPTGVVVEPRSIVFNGVLDYHPNLDAASFFVDHVFPLIRERTAGVRLTIVGRGGNAEFERLRRSDVRVTGEVPDVRPYLEQAAVEVVPVRMGGGTRLKVVEGLALEKAIVSTTLGCEGIDIRHGEHLLVADTAEEFAAAVIRLLEDPGLAQRLGRTGRSLVAGRYSWDAAGESLAELYRSIARGSSPEPPAPRRGPSRTTTL